MTIRFRDVTLPLGRTELGMFDRFAAMEPDAELAGAERAVWQKRLEGTYRDGELEGLYTGWHANGQKLREETFRDGTSTSVTEWDENGNQTSR